MTYPVFSLFSGFDDLNLSINTDMATVVKAMAQPDSGLEIRDRMWLKITIPNAFIGLSQYMLYWLMHVLGDGMLMFLWNSEINMDNQASNKKS